jgi:acyl-CoA hydrolase
VEQRAMALIGVAAPAHRAALAAAWEVLRAGL